MTNFKGIRGFGGNRSLRRSGQREKAPADYEAKLKMGGGGGRGLTRRVVSSITLTRRTLLERAVKI